MLNNQYYRFDKPTQRELEVMHLLAQGYSNKMIAATLGISLRTVEAHLESAYSKLQASGRVDAVIKATRAKWIVLEGL